MDSLLNELKTTPLNIILLLAIGYLIWDIIFPRVGLALGAPIPSSYEESYLWRPKTHIPVIVWKKYSPQTLEEFDGRRNQRILLAINRVVYDVTAGRSFYGPGTLIMSYFPSFSYILRLRGLIEGPYGNFAGRDASRGMAKQSFDLSKLTQAFAFRFRA